MIASKGSATKRTGYLKKVLEYSEPVRGSRAGHAEPLEKALNRLPLGYSPAQAEISLMLKEHLSGSKNK